MLHALPWDLGAWIQNQVLKFASSPLHLLVLSRWHKLLIPSASACEISRHLADSNSWSCGPLTATSAVLSLPQCRWHYEHLAARGSKMKKCITTRSCRSSKWRREEQTQLLQSLFFCSHISHRLLKTVPVTSPRPGFQAHHAPTTKKEHIFPWRMISLQSNVFSNTAITKLTLFWQIYSGIRNLTLRLKRDGTSTFKNKNKLTPADQCRMVKLCAKTRKIGWLWVGRGAIKLYFYKLGKKYSVVSH